MEAKSDEYQDRYIHDMLVEKAKKKLKGLGYKIYDKKYDYNDFSVDEVNAFGIKYIPDIMAKKNKEMLAVEVKTKTSKFVRQLESFKKGGKVILLLGLDNVENIELWGIKELEGGSFRVACS
jgi:hypothetical protein